MQSLPSLSWSRGNRTGFAEKTAVDDEWLVQQCLQGKTAYWNVLVRRYRHVLHERFSLLVRKPEDVEEVAEEVFLQAQMALPYFPEFKHPYRQSRLRRERDSLFFNWLLLLGIEPCMEKARAK